MIAKRSVASKGVTERKRRHKRDECCGCQTGRLCVKSFSPAVGGGRWENSFKDKWVFSIKGFFFQGWDVSCMTGGMQEQGWGWWRDKKIFSGKNFRLWFGGVQQRRDMFSGQNFLRLSILVFTFSRRADVSAERIL